MDHLIQSPWIQANRYLRFDNDFCFWNFSIVGFDDDFCLWNFIILGLRVLILALFPNNVRNGSHPGHQCQGKQRAKDEPSNGNFHNGNDKGHQEGDRIQPGLQQIAKKGKNVGQD